MEKQRSKGVTIFAWLLIIVGFISALVFAAKLNNFNIRLPRILSKPLSYMPLIPKTIDISILKGLSYTTQIAIDGIVTMALGLAILRLKNVARLIVIILCIVYIIEEMSLIINNASVQNISDILFHNLVFISIRSAYIYFLTRPRVKEQFK